MADLKILARDAVAKYRETHGRTETVVVTHHIRWDYPGPHKRHPQSVCGAFVNPDEIVEPGKTPGCPDCKSWLEAYEVMEF